MQIKVTLTEDEIAAVRMMVAEAEPRKGKRTTGPRDRLAIKLGKALDKPAVETKTVGKALWQVIGRPDLKGSLEACKVVVIGGERIVACWRMAEGSVGMGEACAQCGRALGRARLSVIGGPDIDCDADGTVRVSQHLRAPSLAHKACGPKWIGLERRERMVDPAEEHLFNSKIPAAPCACGHGAARHDVTRADRFSSTATERTLCLEQDCGCLKWTKAAKYPRAQWSTAYQRFAQVKPTWREGAIDMTAKWEPWGPTFQTEEVKVA